MGQVIKKGKKQCSICKQWLSLKKFRVNNRNSSGYFSGCRKCQSKRMRAWRANNPDYQKEWGANNPDYQKEWRANNPEKYKAQYMNRDKKKSQDPKYKLCKSMRNGMLQSLKNGSKNGRSWESLVDYTIQDLKKHLEALFDDRMSWDNYGSYWHIDHIRPRSSFNFDKPEDEEFKECWALSNLQPLEAKENLSKGARLDYYD